MPSKVLASQLLVIILQYGLLLLMCLFLYRVIKLIYMDFSRDTRTDTLHKPGKLIVVNRGALVSEQTEFLIGESINIGRGKSNDIIINESTVSYEHACITYYQKQHYLSDLNSTNGVLHNDKRIQQDVVLRRGDKIQIGSTIFRFEE